MTLKNSRKIFPPKKQQNNKQKQARRMLAVIKSNNKSTPKKKKIQSRFFVSTWIPVSLLMKSPTTSFVRSVSAW
jgi:hypothetical protein